MAVSTSEPQGGDQEAFDAVGVPAFAFLQDLLEYETRAHHSNLKWAAVLEASFLFDAAQRVSTIPRKPDPYPELE